MVGQNTLRTSVGTSHFFLIIKNFVAMSLADHITVLTQHVRTYSNLISVPWFCLEKYHLPNENFHIFFINCEMHCSVFSAKFGGIISPQ